MASVARDIRRLEAEHDRDDVYYVFVSEALARLAVSTKRPVVAYAADFQNPRFLFSPQLQMKTIITADDKDHFRDCILSLPRGPLDLIIQSPGGSVEVTESIGEMLRGHFDDIRVIVLGAAKSAATMLALLGQVLCMDLAAELGPTDPQMPINGAYAPAESIIRQFQLAQASLASDPSSAAIWNHILPMYAPSLLIECEDHISLSRSVVAKWLESGMLRLRPDGSQQASAVADWLSDASNFLTHSRKIGISTLREKGLNVLDLESEPDAYPAALELYYAVMLWFQNTEVYKMFGTSSNHLVSLIENSDFTASR